MKSEIQFLAEQLYDIAEAAPWYGDGLSTILQGLTAAQASARPLAKSHTIWEIVKHMTGWAIVDQRRLLGEDVREPEEGDWPTTGTAEDEWQRDLAAIRKASLDLGSAIGQLRADKLESTLARGSGTYREQMHGALQHIVYHSAQIAILKKSLR